MKRKERMENGIIIETKVSKPRKAIELLGTLFFNALIIFLVAVVVDIIYFEITKTHLWFRNLGETINYIEFVGIILLPILFFVFFFISNIWARFKRYLYDPKDHIMEIPTFVCDNDMSTYFEIPIEEVRRRKFAKELIIEEKDNIDNNKMAELRKKHIERVEKYKREHYEHEKKTIEKIKEFHKEWVKKNSKRLKEIKQDKLLKKV
jgi:hypothetical protein